MGDQPQTYLNISNKLSVSEFKAQFYEQTEDLLVQVNRVWGKFKPQKREGMYLTNISILRPWEGDGFLDAGRAEIYWFCKKKLFGYKYPPKFECGCCYRVRVRPCKYSGTGTSYYLEEVLESNVDPQLDDAIYNNVYEKYVSNYSEETTEMLMYIEPDEYYKRAKRRFGGVIGSRRTSYIAQEKDSSGNVSLVTGALMIPFDSRNFKENMNVSLKAGCVYRVKVRPRKEENPDGKQDYMLVSLIGQENDESLLTLCRSIGELNKTPQPDKEDGTFTVLRKNGISVSEKSMPWPAPGKPDADVDVCLECDADNPFVAGKTRKVFNKIVSDKEAWDKKIYDMVVEECRGEGGIEVWSGCDDEDGEGVISEEAFRNRLSISSININADGTGMVFVDLDGMFTDHDFAVDINPDGTLDSHGLWG